MTDKNIEKKRYDDRAIKLIEANNFEVPLGLHSYMMEPIDSYKKNLLANVFNGARVLEIGAGTVVPSIRYDGEGYGSLGVALVRVNPSKNECSKFEVNDPRGSGSDYFALQAYSNVALGALLGELGTKFKIGDKSGTASCHEWQFSKHKNKKKSQVEQHV